MTLKASHNKHTIMALVEDKPGVLNRISSMFRRRGFNISSLAVGQSEIENLSRMTFVVNGDDSIVEQVTKHLHKLIDVVKVSDMTEEHIVNRELVLIKVKANVQSRSEIMQIVDIFRANIIDVSPESLIIEVTGNEDKISSLLQLVDPFGILEIMRTGTIAMTRGLIRKPDSKGLAPSKKRATLETGSV